MIVSLQADYRLTFIPESRCVTRARYRDVLSAGERVGSKSFAVGHLALGYLLGRFSAKPLRMKVNVALLFALSVFPDVDIFFPSFLEHRGPTHSVIVALVVFVPIFVVCRQRAIPYFVALVQHSLLGDYLTGTQTQFFWPLTTQRYGMGVSITSSTSMMLEWIVFFVSMLLMLKLRDFAWFFEPHVSNLVLIIPTFTVLLPLVIEFPLYVPFWLLPPHLVYVFLFLAAVLVAFFRFVKTSL